MKFNQFVHELQPSHLLQTVIRQVELPKSGQVVESRHVLDFVTSKLEDYEGFVAIEPCNILYLVMV